MDNKFILTDKKDEYLIVFDKKYDIDYVKFIVNKQNEDNKPIQEVLQAIEYNFSVSDIYNLKGLIKIWCSDL